MAQQYASGETMRLTLKLTPAATSMTGNKDVGTTSGRFFLSNNNQKEWISFTGKTNNGDGTYTYTGLTRGLSQTADPVTGGTGSTWLANQECILVAMHDQLVDKTQATTFAENITFAKDISFTGTTTGGLTLKSLTQAQINALTPVVGYKVFNTDTGTVQTYYSGTWNNEGTSTTPNASTTVAGKVEIATQAEVNAGTDTGGTGATVVVIPSTLANSTTIPNIHALTEKLTPIGADEAIIWDSVSLTNQKALLKDLIIIADQTAQSAFTGDTDLFVVKQASGGLRKMTVADIRRALINSGFQTSITTLVATSSASVNAGVWTYSSSLATGSNGGGLISAVFRVVEASSNYPDFKIQTSPDNSTWTDIWTGGFIGGEGGSQTNVQVASCVFKAAYVRIGVSLRFAAWSAYKMYGEATVNLTN